MNNMIAFMGRLEIKCINGPCLADKDCKEHEQTK